MTGWGFEQLADSACCSEQERVLARTLVGCARLPGAATGRCDRYRPEGSATGELPPRAPGGQADDQGTCRPARSPAATTTVAEDRPASPDCGGRPGGPRPFGAAGLTPASSLGTVDHRDEPGSVRPKSLSRTGPLRAPVPASSRAGVCAAPGRSRRQGAVAIWPRASASSAGRVNMDSWLPGTDTGEALIRSAKRSQPYSPGGSAMSPADST